MQTDSLLTAPAQALPLLAFHSVDYCEDCGSHVYDVGNLVDGICACCTPDEEDRWDAAYEPGGAW